MPARKVGLPTDVPDDLARGLAAIRERLSIPTEFPADVLAAAEGAAARPRLVDHDRTDLELITIDPPDARDLDQALHIGRTADGYVISYAIADVAAFVSGGDLLDHEAHRRGMTMYAPDRRIPLYPPVLSEGAASLLPDQIRPALLWTIRLDAHGQMVDADVVRARVRSREQLSYEQAQAELDGGEPREVLRLLAEVGTWRESRERDRGGVSLQIPDQEVRQSAEGWTLGYRANLAVEGWNAQISLLTGMAAAHLMLYGQVGILRTLPPADHFALRRLHSTAKALRVPWPAELDYPEFVRSLDPSRPDQAAVLNACASLFRGAAYKAFSGGIPEEAEHAALAIDYAHVTAPLRRLVDRYAGEVCVSLCADQPAPVWVLQALDQLPDEMARAERLAKSYERAVIDLVEVLLLRDRVGETLVGTVVEVEEKGRRGEVMIKEPAIAARVRGDHLPLGHEVVVKLISADPEKGAVEFALA
ncbi:MAG TPA: RNB domain-containing ribonuclease [Microlunatus sp.]